MEGVVVGVLSFLMPEDCVTKYVKDNDFLNVDCFKMLVSKCLGYGIVAGATLVKLPQIIKVLKTGSAKGLSIPAGLLELLCYTATSSYSFYRKFPFSTYGDATFLLVQSAIISFLTISWEISYLYGITFLSSYVCFVAYTLSPAVELSLLTLMQAANTPVILFSRGLQIYANFRNGSTGQLSAISVWLMAAGSLARIFTSIQETGDMLVILNFVVSSFVNIVLSAQIIYYWNCPLPEKKMAENKKTI
ncbi:Mannose-P-dolichol utilization defect 1 protein [Echinococcus granulosus]|uniref:Mannose-P-dolichol utilization defect 1 protein homolog n=1 Tax=Echinococcus granulosus TaxID=6210 RepID=W6V9U5_ECHGR|nr:Mannose-P-dolichol utilization defect 1 protein [Echinococcus granulosus]EUB63439.1 Mannose-P-dolichol utilization defect 1 protein [Echinococcus granulosus]